MQGFLVLHLVAHPPQGTDSQLSEGPQVFVKTSSISAFTEHDDARPDDERTSLLYLIGDSWPINVWESPSEIATLLQERFATLVKPSP